MAELEALPAGRVLDESRRIADHLLDVQGRVNAQIDAMQCELLPHVRHKLGYEDAAAVDVDGLVNTRINRLSIVVTPEAVATVLPLTARSASTSRGWRARSVASGSVPFTFG